MFVCVCVYVYVVYEDTHLYNDTGITQEMVIYEDIFSVPIIQNAYKSYRVSFLGKGRNAQSPVRAKFRCRAIAHTVYTV